MPPKRSGGGGKNRTNQAQSAAAAPPPLPPPPPAAPAQKLPGKKQQQTQQQLLQSQQSTAATATAEEIPPPPPFLVCCVINRINNLRVMVDPSRPCALQWDVNPSVAVSSICSSSSSTATSSLSSSSASTVASASSSAVASRSSTSNSWDAPHEHQQQQPQMKPSRVAFDSSRYLRIAGSSPPEKLHQATAEVASRFNGKFELFCDLYAPTMFHDLTDEQIRDMFRLPSSSSDDDDEEEEDEERQQQQNAKNHDDDNENSEEQRKQRRLERRAKAREQLRLELADEEKEFRAANFNPRRKKTHYAALLRMTFDQDPSLSAASEQALAVSTCAVDQAIAAARKKQRTTKSSSSAAYGEYELVHPLGPVRCMPPVSSAFFVRSMPKTVSLVVVQVPDPEIEPVERLLVRGVCDLLEADEFCGSLPAAHVQNLVHDLPQYNHVIHSGGGGTSAASNKQQQQQQQHSKPSSSSSSRKTAGAAASPSLHSCWTAFVNHHAGREWAVLQYSQEQLDSIFPSGVKPVTLTAREPRMVAWKHLERLIEGDLARDQSRRASDDEVRDKLLLRLAKRDMSWNELLQTLKDSRAFLSTVSPNMTKMLEVVEQNPRMAVLRGNPLHPVIVEPSEMATMLALEEMARQEREHQQQQQQQQQADDDGDQPQ